MTLCPDPHLSVVVQVPMRSWVPSSSASKTSHRRRRSWSPLHSAATPDSKECSKCFFVLMVNNLCCLTTYSLSMPQKCPGRIQTRYLCQQLPSWTRIWTRKDMSTITPLDPKGYVNNYPPGPRSGPERICQQLPSWTRIWNRNKYFRITILVYYDTYLARSSSRWGWGCSGWSRCGGPRWNPRFRWPCTLPNLILYPVRNEIWYEMLFNA